MGGGRMVGTQAGWVGVCQGGGRSGGMWCGKVLVQESGAQRLFHRWAGTARYCSGKPSRHPHTAPCTAARCAFYI